MSKHFCTCVGKCACNCTPLLKGSLTPHKFTTSANWGINPPKTPPPKGPPPPPPPAESEEHTMATIINKF